MLSWGKESKFKQWRDDIKHSAKVMNQQPAMVHLVFDITIAKGAAPYDISAEITTITHKFLEHKLWSVHFWLFWPKILNLGPYKEHDEETWEMGAHRKDLHWSSLETLVPPRTLSLAPPSLATVRRTQHSPLLGRE